MHETQIPAFAEDVRDRVSRKTGAGGGGGLGWGVLLERRVPLFCRLLFFSLQAPKRRSVGVREFAEAPLKLLKPGPASGART